MENFSLTSCKYFNSLSNRKIFRQNFGNFNFSFLLSFSECVRREKLFLFSILCANKATSLEIQLLFSFFFRVYSVIGWNCIDVESSESGIMLFMEFNRFLPPFDFFPAPFSFLRCVSMCLTM
jgi:hypothetical protein